MKSLVVYKLATPVAITNEMLAAKQFQQCGAHDASRSGYSPIEGDNFVINGSGETQIIKFTTQAKKPKKAEVKRQLALAVEEYIEEFGDSPSKQELKTMEAEVIEKLLPSTPADEEKHALVVISPTKVYVEGNYKQAETILESLRNILGSLQVELLNTSQDASKWLSDMVVETITPDNFVLGDKVSLVTADELNVTQTKGSVYGSSASDLVKEGGVVTSLQMEFNSYTLFTLKDDLSMSGFKYAKDLFEGIDADDTVGVMLKTVAEVLMLADDLVVELGGLVEE